MRQICLYTWGPDFHCVVRMGSPQVVQEALADLKMNRTNNLQSQAVLSHASGHVWGDFITNKEKMNEFEGGHV